MGKFTKPVLIFAILIVIFSTCIVENAKADISPPVAPGIGGLEPFDYQDTQVQMVYERVEMELFTVYEEGFEDEPPTYKINVVAWFVMRNQGNQAEQMQAMFPTKNFNDCLEFNQVSSPPSYAHYEIVPDSFNFQVDGENVPFTEIETKHPYDEICKSPGWDMTWAAFDVTFPVDKDVLVRVEYQMQSYSQDKIHNMQYILETGSGWKGPIGTAYIIVKFPNIVSQEFIIEETTNGYQTLHNEIFWSFKNIEPTRNDNILVSFVAPDIWLKINTLKGNISNDPNDIDSWIELAKTYNNIGSWKPNQNRSQFHVDKAYDTYYEGVKKNPNKAEMLSAYASFLFDKCCMIESPSEKNINTIQPLIEKALSLDPSNETAHILKVNLENSVDGLTINVPNTHTPTPTLTPVNTKVPTYTKTHQATITATQPETQTVLITSTSTSTSTPEPTVTFSPEPDKQVDTDLDDSNADFSSNNELSIIVFVIMIIFAGVMFWRVFIRSQNNDSN